MDILLVSTAEWDNPYWTNKQHVAVQLAALGHRVFYIESQGLRAPTATKKDLKRIWKRLRRGLKAPVPVRPNMWVWSPISIPLQRYAIVRLVNRITIQAGLKFWNLVLGFKPDIIWTYSPMTTEFYSISSYKLSVYHAVDDIKAQPGMPRETIEKSEATLSRSVDLIFTTALNLQLTHEVLNPDTHYFSNVADYQHFNKALDVATETPFDIADIASPRIGFVGAISGYKLDFEMIREAAVRRPDWSFVFVGEIGEGAPGTDASSIQGLDNLHFLGGRPYDELPGYLKGMDVALLPNRINEYTLSMFPMKFFEYLAAGRPVVATRLHALKDFGHVAAFADDTDSFISAINDALGGRVASLEIRLGAAREHTYERRTEKMMALVVDRLAKQTSKNR